MSARFLCWVSAGALFCVACGPTQKVDRVPETSGDADSASAAAAPDAGAQPISESERTRLMDQKASELVQQYQDAQATATTAEERVKAYQEFEKGRQQLDQSAEGQSAPAPAADDEYAPPPLP